MIKKIKSVIRIFFSILIVFTLFGSFTFNVHADASDRSLDSYIIPKQVDPGNTTIDPNTGNVTGLQASLSKVVINFSSGVMGSIGIVVLIFFIIAGIMYITSQGKPDEVKKATAIFQWSIIGLVVIFLSYSIITLFFNLVSSFKN